MYATFLDSLENFGARLGLERIQGLLHQLGDPQDRIPAIHVAGTNGKGSTCAFVSAILQAAGYRVGRYTSPHLVDWRERITVNGKPISSDDFDQLLTRLRPQLPEGITQFELQTAAAFEHFRELALDVMVIEVGLGGRLDATNVIARPCVTAVTSIDLDHCHILGETLALIAREKAGILKPGVPVITAQLPLSAQQVIFEVADAQHCPVRVVPASRPVPSGYQYQGLTYHLQLQGAIQAQNSAVALAICQELVNQGWCIPQTAQRLGLEQARWPGRYQIVSYQGHQLLIDGAHNPEGLKVLRKFVDAWGCSVSWIIGILDKKDSREMLQLLLKPGDEFFAVPIPHSASHAPLVLVEQARLLQPELSQNLACTTVSEALSHITARPVLCGSLYLIGDFLAELGYTAETL